MRHEFRQLNGIFLFCVLAFLAIISGGCVTTNGEIFSESDRELVWPKPPDSPRIAYVGQISTEENLKKGDGFVEVFAKLLFGKNDIGVLVSPVDVVVDDEQKVFVADTGGGVIHIFDLADRNYSQFSKLVDNESLMMPVALLLIDNHLYVVDSIRHAVYVFDKKGRFLRSFGQELLERPSGIAYSATSEKIFISDTGKHTIYAFDKNGKNIKQIGVRGVEQGMFNFPTRLCSDSAGRIYVSDTLNYRIQIFSDQGEFVSMFGEQGDRPGYFAHPAGIATDERGNIFVVDRQFENIQVFNEKGEVRMVWGDEGSTAGQFWLPAGIFISKGKMIYVADSFNKRIQVFESQEEFNNYE